MVEFVFELLPGNEPPYEYAPGHVTITTDHGTGTSKPGYYFMMAVSLTDMLDTVRPFLQHGKMSGCHWNLIDASFSVHFQRVTKRLKGQAKPIRIVCGDSDLGAVSEAELVRAITDGTRCFLRENTGLLGEDQMDLVRSLNDFETAFGLDGAVPD